MLSLTDVDASALLWKELVLLFSGALETRAGGPVTINTYISYLWKMLTVPLLFTLNLEGLSDNKGSLTG
jgi:hypothetical protein